MSFVNKVVLITGAGSGLGAAVALHFAKLDAKLCIIDINAGNLHKISDECEKISKSEVLKVVADLSKTEEVKNIIQSALKKYGKIDVLINCAGIYGPGRLKDADIIEKYDKVMSVNLRSVIVLTSLATPALIETKGCVINISSIAASLPFMNVLPYNISKAGVTHFTKSAALELANDGVRVNCISPGPVRTNILLNAGMEESQAEAFWQSEKESTALKRVAEAKEIAAMAEFLASEKAISITGAEFIVDGGYLLCGAVVVPVIDKQ